MSRFGFVYAYLHSNITESNTKMDAHDPKPAFLLMKRLPCDRTTRFLLVSRKRRWLTHQNRYSHKPNRSVFPNSVPHWIRFPSPGTYIKTALVPKGARAVKLSCGAGDGKSKDLLRKSLFRCGPSALACCAGKCSRIFLAPHPGGFDSRRPARKRKRP